MNDLAIFSAHDTTANWEQKITAAWRDSVEGIFRVGDLLTAAKADRLCQFDEMRLPFERNTTQRLMTIAQDQRLRSWARAPLPSSWMTLYELTKLTDDQLSNHADQITPELDRGTVTIWRKRIRRATRERHLAAKTIAAAVELEQECKLYGVIYADPPWRFEPYSRETGMDRAADQHYPTLSLAEIGAMKPPAADDAALFLWATVPMLPQALAVMSSWGFTYKSHFVWVKHKRGTGYWNRNRHELLLIGTRGDIPAPAPGEQYDSVIEARAGRHSAKPFHFHEIIESMFPTLPRLEMFARSKFAGWDSWGNEVIDDAA